MVGFGISVGARWIIWLAGQNPNRMSGVREKR